MNVATVKAAVKALTPAVDLVLLTMAKAEVLREKIDALDVRLLAEGEYMIDEKWAEYGDEGRILAPKTAYLMGDEDAAVYHARRDEVIRAEYDVKPGYCPALIAEGELRDANRLLVDLAATEIDGFEHMTADRLLMGTEGKCGLTLYAEFIDLLIKIVVNAPGGYKSPLAA